MKLKTINKKQVIVLLFVFLIILCGYSFEQLVVNKSNNNENREIIQFERCVDGDTFVAKTKKFGSTKIRLSGVNTPELAHPEDGIQEEYYGKEAQVYTCKRLKSAKNMTVEWDTTQEASHGRQIGIVFIEDQNFNLELFKEGYSSDRYLRNKMPYSDQYRKALTEAKQNKKGMWSKS